MTKFFLSGEEQEGMNSIPSIMLYGENYAGKTIVANALREDFGFNIFSMGEFWLNMMNCNSPAATFSNEEVAAFRKHYIARKGVEGIVRAVGNRRPMLVDGVRSFDIADALAKAAFIPVYITAPFETRSLRANIQRPLVQGKSILSAADLAKNDMMHAEQIGLIRELGGLTLQNDGNAPLQSLVSNLVTMLASNGSIK